MYIPESMTTTVRENYITKKRYVENKNSKPFDLISPVVYKGTKYHLIVFNNLNFINMDSYTFNGNFSLIYKIDNFVEFSYYSHNFEEVLKAIIESYLQSIFNNYKYYNCLKLNSYDIKNDLNRILINYVDGVKIADCTNIVVENHYNLIFDKNNNLDEDYNEYEINSDIINMYDNEGTFTLSKELINSYNLTSNTNLKKNINYDNNYINANEYGVTIKDKVSKSGLYINKDIFKDINSLTDNVLTIGPIRINKNTLEEGRFNYVIETKVVYDVINPEKYIKNQKDFKFIDYMNYCINNFLYNFDKIYKINKLPNIINHDSYITLFKMLNEEHLIKLNEFGINIKCLCIVGLEKESYQRKM